jgi:polysaccharide biosynthesis transport protein
VSALFDVSPTREQSWARSLWSRTPGGVALAVLVCLLGTLAGGWYGARQAAVHEATAVVLISPLAGNPFSPDGAGSDLVNLETEAQLVRSDTVADDVITDLGLDLTPAELLDGVSVEVPPNTQIVRITAASESEDDALARAQAVAESYLEFRQTRARAASSILADQVAEQVANGQADLTKKTRQLAGQDPASATAVLLRQQVIDGTTQIGELRAQLSALQATRADPGEVVTPAALPKPGLLGTRELMAALGLMLGLGGSVGFAAVRARRDPRARTVEDLVDVGVPVLGEVVADSDGDDLATAGLRASILAALPQRPLTLAVVGAGQETRVVEGLGRSIARARHEVVLVDLVGTQGDREGLSDLVLDRAAIDDVTLPVTAHLSKVAPGRSPERLADLLGSPDMSVTMEDLGKRCDVVLLDAGSSAEAVSHAVVRHTHGVLLEVRAGQTTLDDIGAARSVVWGAGGQVVGLVLVHGAGKLTP